MTHHPQVTAKATAATVGVVYIVCRLLVFAVPGLFLSITRTWFHGIDISRIEAVNTAGNFGSFVVGLVSSIIAGWLVGYLFAYFYNSFEKSK